VSTYVADARRRLRSAIKEHVTAQLALAREPNRERSLAVAAADDRIHKCISDLVHQVRKECSPK
jgi:hypothetical protein